MKKYVLSIVLLSVFLFTACNKNETENFIEPEAKQTTDLKTLLKQTGIDALDKDVEMVGNNFIIEGDMSIPFNSLYEIEKESNLKGYTYERPVYCSQNKVKSIKVFVKSNVPQRYKEAVNQALNAWGQLSSITKVRFSKTNNASNATITIRKRTQADEGTYVAQANLPLNGKVGRYIIIDLNAAARYSASELKNIMTHELAHTIGLAHTDGHVTGGSTRRIPGTKVDDGESSVMYRYPHAWTGWSEDDKKSISTLFPK